MSVISQPCDPASPPERSHRYQTGPHHRRLAAPRRPHHCHQRMGPHRLQQLVDEAGATVKIEGIGFGEGAQPLVRVAYGGHVPRSSVRLLRLSPPRRRPRFGARRAESLPPSRSGWRAGRPWPEPAPPRVRGAARGGHRRSAGGVAPSVRSR